MTATGYFDHDADVGVEGRGITPAAAFEQAAQSMFGIMLDLDQVRPLEHLEFDFEEDDPELALVTWLNRLLAEARAHRLALGRFRLDNEGAHWHGAAWGEPWRSELERGVEVKGATLTMLSVTPDAQGWLARCVVDV